MEAQSGTGHRSSSNLIKISPHHPELSLIRSSDTSLATPEMKSAMGLLTSDEKERSDVIVEMDGDNAGEEDDDDEMGDMKDQPQSQTAMMSSNIGSEERRRSSNLMLAPLPSLRGTSSGGTSRGSSEATEEVKNDFEQVARGGVGGTSSAAVSGAFQTDILSGTKKNSTSRGRLKVRMVGTKKKSADKPDSESSKRPSSRSPVRVGQYPSAPGAYSSNLSPKTVGNSKGITIISPSSPDKSFSSLLSEPPMPGARKVIPPFSDNAGKNENLSLEEIKATEKNRRVTAPSTNPQEETATSSSAVNESFEKSITIEDIENENLDGASPSLLEPSPLPSPGAFVGSFTSSRSNAIEIKNRARNLRCVGVTSRNNNSESTFNHTPQSTRTRVTNDSITTIKSHARNLRRNPTSDVTDSEDFPEEETPETTRRPGAQHQSREKDMKSSMATTSSILQQMDKLHSRGRLDDTDKPASNILIGESSFNRRPSSSSAGAQTRPISVSSGNNENDRQRSQNMQNSYTFNTEVVESPLIQEPVKNDKNFQGLSNGKLRFAGFFICLLFSGVIAGIVILMIAGRDNNGGNSNGNDDSNIFSNNPPTLSPINNDNDEDTTNSILQQCFNSTFHQSSLYVRIRDSIIAASHVPDNILAMDTPQTPQHKSLCWISLVDQSVLYGDPLVERFSLVTLYYEWVNEDEKNILLNKWLSGDDHCEWEGVGCKALDSKTDIVSILEFVDMYLGGSIPPEIGNLRGLELLRLESNSINGPIPSEIRNLQNLRTLVITQNNFFDSFESQIPDSIFDLPLVHFSLQSNGLKGSIPNGFDRLSKLEILRLGSNNFKGPIPSTIGSLEELDILDLSRNKLSGPIPSTLHQLTSLEKLHLNNNFLNGTLPTFLGGFTNLDIFDISTNDFESTIPTQLGSLTNVAEMKLYDNELFGAIPSSLGNLTNAQIIFFAANDLTGDMPQEICNLRQVGRLVRLDCDCGNLDLERGSGQKVYCSRGCCTACPIF